MNTVSSCQSLCNLYPNFRLQPNIRRDLRPPCTSIKFEEPPKLKWINPRKDLMPEEERAISQLPWRMSKRCKALLKRLICFSGQDDNLHFLLGAWVKTMFPRRADWLAVLKEMKRMEHPLYTDVLEYALLDDTFEAHVRDYTKLIHALGKQNDLDKAEITLQSMRRRGFPCDVVSLTALIDLYSKGGDLRRAKQIFDEIKLLGLNYDKRAYGSMVMAYIRADMLEEAERLIKKSEDEEIYTGSEVYKALLRAYSNKGQTGDARCVIENMRKAGLRPCEKCINLMIDAYEKNNRLDKALEFLSEMERERIAIPRDVLRVLRRWFDRIGVKEEMYEILEEVCL